MAKAAVRSKVVVRFLLIRSLLLFPLWEFCICSMFCCAVMCALSCFAVIFFMGKRDRAGSVFCLVFRYLLTVIVMWFFLMVPWVGLQCVLVVIPNHAHLPFR